MTVSPARRHAILDALRRGTVPEEGLDALAVGLDRFASTLEEELRRVGSGGSTFKAVRGEYGSGKTFFCRWFTERARRAGFASSEVQISENETPLHRLETVYRRVMERLSTSAVPAGALRSIVDAWFYALEQDALDEPAVSGGDTAALERRTAELLTARLGAMGQQAPIFAAALRGYRQALADGDEARASGLIAWLAGQPNVAAAVKRRAGIRGEIDHYGAFNFLKGLLLILRDSGYGGLVLILDEMETLQRVRSDVREKGLNSLRQWMDEIDSGRFPGLYLVVTGTPAFFDGPMGVQRLPPLAQRLHVDFAADPTFDNPRAPQIRLQPFDLDSLTDVGVRVRELFAAGAKEPERIRSVAGDDLVRDLARGVAGKLGGKVGISPRIYLKKLVVEVLDKIELFDSFDPRRDYALTVSENELTDVERAARGALGPDDVELEL